MTMPNAALDSTPGPASQLAIDNKARAEAAHATQLNGQKPAKPTPETQQVPINN
jgi:hypothetical protein